MRIWKKKLEQARAELCQAQELLGINSCNGLKKIMMDEIAESVVLVELVDLGKIVELVEIFEIVAMVEMVGDG